MGRYKSRRSLYKATGGAWGGTKVNIAFEELLGKIFGETVVGKFKQHHLEDYIDMFRDFEIKKREISLSKDTQVTMRIPRSFFDLVNEVSKCPVKEWIAKTKYANALSVIGDKIRFSPSIARSCFENTITSIVSHVAMLLKEPIVAGCSAVVLVGGFSESVMLQEAIAKRFGSLKIIVPQEAGLAVLKGAVIYGHQPKVIVARVCKYTYGDSVVHVRFNHCNHPRGKVETGEDGQIRCCDIFRIHVKVGQDVKLGEETEEIIATPMYADQTVLFFEMYVASNPSRAFVTEPGFRRIGEFIDPIPDTSMGLSRSFRVSLIFGDTEIIIAELVLFIIPSRQMRYIGSPSIVLSDRQP